MAASERVPSARSLTEPCTDSSPALALASRPPLAGFLSRARAIASSVTTSPPAPVPLYIAPRGRGHGSTPKLAHQATRHPIPSFVNTHQPANMSDKCGNCDCADKTQCPKKGNSYGVVIVDSAESRFERQEEVTTATENDGCKCGTSCSCTNCTCGK